MGSSHSSHSPVVPLNQDANNNRVITQGEDFDTRWKRFIESLDISSLHVKHVESLDKQKRLELLLSFEAKNPERPVSHYVNTLKNFDWGLLLNPKKRDSGNDLRTLLLSTEISLRTDSVGWVYEFLNYDGLDILHRFMSTCLELIFWPAENTKRSTSASDQCGSLSKPKPNYESQLPRDASVSCSLAMNGENPPFIDENVTQFPHGQSACRFNPQRIVDILNNRILPDGSRRAVPKGVKALLKECLHLSLRCLKTILNNQHGCKRAFDHPDLLTVLTFCLLHPSYATKALVLDILTALCLIEGGHSKVLHGFDRLRRVMGEGLRFELLLTLFRCHEGFDAEQYNVDFPVACVQFFNIVVHCPENINLRVYLQHELFLLGLDDTLKKLRYRADDRLKQHVEAYLDNRVDCSLLLEDAEAKEAAVSELERVEADLVHKLNAVKEATRVELEAAFRVREMELSNLVDSLRIRIRDLNVSSWDRENAIKQRMEELNQALKASRTEVAYLQAAVESIKSKSINVGHGVHTASMATSTNFEADVPASLDASDSHCEHPQSASLGLGALRSNSLDVGCLKASPRLTNGTLPPGSFIEDDANKCSTDPSGKHVNGPQKPVRKHAQPTSPFRGSQSKAGDCPVKDLSAVRQLALNATSALSQLLQRTSCKDPNSSVSFVVPPIGWKPINRRQSVKDSIFDSAIFQKSVNLYPLNVGSEQVDDLWTICSMHLAEPWLSATQRCEAVFARHSELCTAHNGQSNSSRFMWLAEMQLVQCDIVQQLVSSDSVPLSSLADCELFRQLTRFELNCVVAQRLLHQMRTESELTSPDIRSDLFGLLESALEQKFICTRQALAFYPTAAENRWFLTASFLHITLLKQLWPAELQRVTESLSALLAACMSILVNPKLPIIVRLILECASRVTANWNMEGFQLQSLDVLLDWTLSGLTVHTTPLQPPADGGPPAYSPNMAGSEKTRKAPTSFLQSFALLVSRVAPNILDWPGDLCHLEAASRVSITEIIDRIGLLEVVCKVWHTLLSSDSRLRELDTELRSTTNSHLACDVVNTQLIQLHQAADSVDTVVFSTAHWLLQLPLQTPSPSSSIQRGWLAPLARFATAFERCVSDLDENLHDHCVAAEKGASVDTPHMREQRRRRNEPHAHGGGKREHRRKKHRTRQLDSDGIMDDILAGLTSQPLRADVHVKRTDSAPPKHST
ncbi:hypothetical protein CRM22_007247 [Opisthorchis felineus]|uniref:GBD/FH3 domain-containing protein n=1 Tax=Opisthorchis felineus TaxID=147828 RepID=A0A4S2LPI7_OPIFE|nr:hypothetical protein CRM22_007247 [Opisthorchis felineus]